MMMMVCCVASKRQIGVSQQCKKRSFLWPQVAIGISSGIDFQLFSRDIETQNISDLNHFRGIA